MGAILKMECPCGYVIEGIFAGGGMSNFETVSMLPARCTKCGTAGAYNTLARRNRCRACQGPIRFYDDPSLRSPGPVGDDHVFWWNSGPKGPLVLDDTTYLCPGCGKFTARFSNVGCWD